MAFRRFSKCEIVVDLDLGYYSLGAEGSNMRRVQATSRSLVFDRAGNERFGAVPYGIAQ
jgi:hypothetical protein